MAGSIGSLIPELRGPATSLVTLAGQYRLNPRVTSTRRSASEQARLYSLYQQGLSQYPAAAPGTSSHEFGYAFDLVVSPMDYLAWLGQVWESWGGKWGGRFGDPVHFEYPGFVPPEDEGLLSKAIGYASWLYTPLLTRSVPRNPNAPLYKYIGKYF